MAKELVIESKHGTFIVLYDKEDEDLIKAHIWHISQGSKSNKDRYSVKTNIPHPDGGTQRKRNPATGNWMKSGKRYQRRYLSRLIMDEPKGMLVDHVNGDTMDNRRSNLRICSKSENGRNRKIASKNNTSGFKGVSYRKKGPDMINEWSRPWQAYINYDKKRHYLGTFATAEEAARAYNLKAKELHGEFARLNFPNEKNTEKKIPTFNDRSNLR